MAFERLGIDVALHASSEVSGPAVRATRARWPSCVRLGDVNLVDRARVRELLSRAPHLKVAFVAGGSPCQGVSRIDATGAGWGDERTELAQHIPRVAALIKEEVPEVTVHALAENVASMSEADRE